MKNIKEENGTQLEFDSAFDDYEEDKEKLIVFLDEKITILSPPGNLSAEIKKHNTFPNPKYESNEQNGYSNWDTPETIKTYQFIDGELSVPRGYFLQLLKLCSELDIPVDITDNRDVHPVLYPSLKGITLRTYQKRAVDQAMQSDQGVIVSPTGSGKSLIGLQVIQQRQQKALIIVHRSDLAKQWISVIKERMGLNAGYIGDGQWEIENQITIAMVQTLATREKDTKALSQVFGLILLDEAHHAPASTFFDVLGLLAAKYRYGLSATPTRRDGLEPMIYMAIGPSIAIIDKDEVETIGATVPATAISIQTGFSPGWVTSWSEYLDTLTTAAERNQLIINLAMQADGAALILVDRVAHAKQLAEMLDRRNIDYILAHGKIKKKDREEVMERIKSAKLTVGTTGLLGEGLDVASWSTLIMGSPISSEIKLMQAIGRIVRPCPGKKNALIYDLKDDCGFSGASFKKRFAIYQKNNIWVNFRKAA